MTALTDAAALAYAAELARREAQAKADAEAAATAEAAAAAAREEQRRVLQQAATAALRAVLTYKDATGATVTKTMTELGLTRAHTEITVEPPSGVVVWSSGDVHLAAQLNRDGMWVVRMVEGSGTSWTPKPGADGQPIRIRDLADLGAALAV